jgi:hypothetical protein
MATRVEERKQWVDEQLAAGSNKTRAELRAEYDQKFPKEVDVKTLDPQRLAELQAKVTELFPGFEFFFTADAGGFGTDVRDLLLRAVANDYTEDRFKKEYQSTKYFLETDKSIREWNIATPEEKLSKTATSAQTIRDTYGDLFEDDALLTKAAEGAARLGLSGTRLRSYLFQSAAQSKSEKAQISQTATADKIRQIGADYGYTVTQDELDSVLTGQPERGSTNILTEQALKERAKLALVGENPHLKQQIDAGLTMKSMFTNYQTEAAELLEVDPNSISVSDPKFRQALAYRDPKSGQVRQLSLSEWRQIVRTDKQFNYQYTKQANKDATDLGLTIARAFGKVM